MKKAKTSARLGQPTRYYIELHDEVATTILRVGHNHGLKTLNQTVCFILGWAA